MKVSELIALLADVLERSSLARSDHQLRQLAVLRDMPAYTQRRQLDEWEHAYPTSDAGSKPVMKHLLREVYELGRYNLYTEFDPKRTLKVYSTLAALFLKHGLQPPQVDAIEDF